MTTRREWQEMQAEDVECFRLQMLQAYLAGEESLVTAELAGNSTGDILDALDDWSGVDGIHTGPPPMWMANA